MEDKEFKNYKEKQAYYKNRAKQKNMFWTSVMPKMTRDNAHKVKENLVIKGRTYLKGDNK